MDMGVGYSTITRYQQTRSASVLGAVDDTRVPSTTSVIDKIRERATAEILPRYPGIDVQYLGQAEEMRKSFSSLKMAFPIAILIIYGMLAGLFKSYTQPLVVMSAIGIHLLVWGMTETRTAHVSRTPHLPRGREVASVVR